MGQPLGYENNQELCHFAHQGIKLKTPINRAFLSKLNGKERQPGKVYRFAGKNGMVRF
jgi:hypothetical protein